MGDAELRAGRMGHRVDRAERRGAARAGDDRLAGGHEHVATGVLVGGVLDGDREVVAHQPQRVQREGLAVRAALAAGVALDRVGHRVHAGGRGDVRRQGRGGLGIEDRQPREEGEVAEEHLEALLGVLDHRSEGDLRAGPGGGGNAGDGRRRQRSA